MKKTYNTEINNTEDDLSVIFNTINETYAGNPKLLIPNYSTDGYLYILVYNSTLSSDKAVTLLCCDRTNILQTLSFNTLGANPKCNAYAAIDNHICIPDSVNSSNYRLKDFYFDTALNTITLSSIENGNNYMATTGCCYYDLQNHPHYIVTFNRSVNNIGDYDLIDRSYQRLNSGTHRFACLLTNKYQGIANKKAFIFTNLYNSLVYVQTLDSLYRASAAQSLFVQVSNTVNITNNSRPKMLGLRYNNPELYRCFINEASSNWATVSVREVYFNNDLTLISVSNTFSPAGWYPAFPPLYVNDQLTKYWTLDVSTMNIVLIDETI